MKKHLFLLFSVFIFFQNVGLGQDVGFYSQEQVDAFDTGITTIEGNLTIEGNDIVDLSNLSNIISIEGGLSIEKNTALQTLTGLGNLTSVGWYLWIEENAALETLIGLESLIYVERGGRIEKNPALQTLTGLENLTSVGGDLEILGNIGLENINGLESLTFVEESLVVGHTYDFSQLKNVSLQNINGLVSLTSVGEDLRIHDNDDLQNLNGLESLTFVGRNLWIDDNDNLESLADLENLSSVGGYLRIRGNDALQNLAGLENLTSVEGDLLIGGDDHSMGNDSLQSLTGLESLTSIGGSLEIFGNESLQSLTGLENLSFIGGSLEIGSPNLSFSESGNASLQNIASLKNLTSVEGDLIISDNDSLQSLTGLENLTVVGGLLSIHGNNILQSLAGLENLTSIGGGLGIHSNNTLQSLVGLENLTSIESGGVFIISNNAIQNLAGLENITFVGGDLWIYYNYALQNLAGLENLTSVEGDLLIENNSALQNLTDLEDLTFIEGDLTIFYNNTIKSLTGLENIISIGGNLQIEDNNKLTNCCGIQQLLFDPEALGGSINISNNLSECSSLEEILTTCDNISSVKGCMYWDENQNGIKDNAEKSLSNISSFVYPDEIITLLDTAGCFTHFFDNGNYTFTYTPSPLWQLNSDSAQYDIIVNDDNHNNLDFGFIPVFDIIAGNLDVTSGIPRCFREVEFDFNFRNEGTTILDGIMWGQVWDEWMEVADYIQPPDTIDAAANGVRWGWFYEDLYPGELLQKTVILEMPEINEEGFDLGDLYLVTSTVEANGHTGGTEFYNYRLNEEIVCAYDPNDKLVSPDRESAGNYTLFEEDLFYTIRFQNTGNDTAFTVVVRDTLDENLNTSTFRLLASSHQGILRTEIAESQYVTFTFDDIMLPDSSVNFNGSQGYVIYVIQANEGLDENTVIENTASIYFDFNPPIVTNTTQNTMVSCLPVEETTIEVSIASGESYTLPDGMVVNETGTYTTEILNEEECPTEIIITILDVLSGTNTLVWNEHIVLSPNPTETQFVLDIETNESINHQLILTNIYGQTVLTKYIHQSQTKVDVEDLVAGIYWVQLRNESNELVAAQKLLIAK